MTAREDEFRAWAAARRPKLLRTATLLAAGDSHLAEDVVQTTLTRLYVKWSKVRDLQQRDAYARRVLVNAFTDEVRRSWRRSEESRAELPDSAGPAGLHDDETRALYAALSTLPTRMRAAIVLRYFHGLSTQEAADALRCTQGTVKSQTARALSKLQSELGPILRPEPEFQPTITRSTFQPAAPRTSTSATAPATTSRSIR